VTVLLAHAGPGSTWQAMVVVASVVLAGALLLAVIGRLSIADRDDLLVPLAAAAIASSLGPLAHEWLSDGIGWALPLGVVSLLAILLGALTPLELRLPAPLAMGSIALAVVSSVLLYPTLTGALHPPGELLPLSDDSEVRIVVPADGEQVEAGPVSVVVEVAGGSIGPGQVPLADLPDDPEEAGDLAVAIEEVREDGGATQQQRIEVDYAEECTLAAPCDQVSFVVPAGPGTWQLTVDFTRGDGTPLAPFVRDRVTFVAE
jgi:hypothetical protein